MDNIIKVRAKIVGEMPGWIILDKRRKLLGFCWKDAAYDKDVQWQWEGYGYKPGGGSCASLKDAVNDIVQDSY